MPEGRHLHLIYLPFDGHYYVQRWDALTKSTEFSRCLSHGIAAIEREFPPAKVTTVSLDQGAARQMYRSHGLVVSHTINRDWLEERLREHEHSEDRG